MSALQQYRRHGPAVEPVSGGRYYEYKSVLLLQTLRPMAVTRCGWTGYLRRLEVGVNCLNEMSQCLLIPRSPPRSLSLIFPIYNEEDVLPLLRRRLTGWLEQVGVPTELIVVNDGSSDNSLELIISWANDDRRIRIVGLARNFGHQAAVTAGLDAARGDAVVIMDADLQDPPEVIAQMLQEYAKGYDVVNAKRRSRSGEGRFKRLSAWCFYRLMKLFIHKDLPADTGDFRLISRPCLDALRSMRETHRFLRGMVAWVGFAQTAVQFDRPARCAGKTKYSLLKMLRFAWTAAVSFSPAPLRISLVIGFLLALFGLADGAYAVARSFLGHYNVPGWTSVMATMCLIGGGTMLGIGILGEYIGRIFEEVKGRPLYVVSYQQDAPFDCTRPTSPSISLAAGAPDGQKFDRVEVATGVESSERQGAQH